MSTLSGTVVVITGASSGIGAATAVTAARQGARLVLGARRVERLQEVAARCRTADGAAAPVEVLHCDVAQRGQVDALVACALEKFGRLDVMLANAGFGLLASVERLTEPQFDEIFAVNVKGTWYAMQAALRVMTAQTPRTGAPRRAARGHIIAVSSAAGRRSLPLYGAYALTKAAQLSLCEAMRVECRGSGVYVSSVHPMTTATEFFDAASQRSGIKSSGVGPAQSAEVVARKIAGLIRRPRPELWPVIGSGWMLALSTLLPRMSDYFMAKSVYRRTR